MSKIVPKHDQSDSDDEEFHSLSSGANSGVVHYSNEQTIKMISMFADEDFSDIDFVSDDDDQVRCYFRLHLFFKEFNFHN